MSLYGYTRVSTTDQNLGLQQAALEAAGCEVSRAEKVTGTTREGRTELATLLGFVRQGDTLVVTRIDRLARSIGDMQDVVRVLKAKGAALRATEQPIDTSTAAGKAFLDMLGVFAEFETNLRRERRMEGIAAAKARGVYAGKGRKPTIDVAEVRRLKHDEKLGPAAIARRQGDAGGRVVTVAPFRAKLEAMAAALKALGDYRVVRRLDARPPLPSQPAGSRLGVVVDTTGPDVRGDEIIEFAMVRFAYSPEGEVLGVVDTFQCYHEPTRPISAEITALTGISAKTVAGHALDPEAVGAFVAPAVIVLAHNAAFDRRFAERLHPWFSTKAWGCTMGEPPWREEGFEGTKLAYLAAHSGFFYDKHRALADWLATLELLARPLPASGRTALAHLLPASGRTALAHLLERARRPSFRLWAEGAPFEHKDTLKGRGDRWSGGEDGRPRAWWIDLAEEALEAGVAFLREHVFGFEVEPLQRRISAYDRYSERV